MAEIIRMPKLSDTMTEGVLAKWHKKEGDPVKSGDILAEIETDKATMDFESFYDGELLHVGIKEGATVPVDAVIAVIGKKGEDFKAALEQAKAGESQGGSDPEKESRSAQEAPRPAAPVAASGTSEQDSLSKKPVPSAPNTSASPASILGLDGRIKASPLAKKLAREKGIDLGAVNGSGDGGRITKKDIEQHTPGASAPPFTPALVSGQEGYRDEAVSQMRKTIARRLAESKFTAPHFYLGISIRMDKAVEARKAINSVQDGVKISYNDMVIKAAALALTRHPKVNSSWLGDKIRYYQHVNVGVAVAVDEGLLVPVVRHANLKSLASINAEVKNYAQKARDKKLQPSDWEGSTFTISNLGMFGIEEFTAIINPPDSCILAVGGMSQVPVVENGQVVPGQVMKVTLSCDHRVVDGATGAAFLQSLKDFLEDPVRMLL